MALATPYVNDRSSSVVGTRNRRCIAFKVSKTVMGRSGPSRVRIPPPPLPRPETALARGSLAARGAKLAPLELYLLHGEIERELRERGLEPARRLVGPYITSLEMAGASLTVLALDDELTALWDAPVHTAALRWGA